MPKLLKQKVKLATTTALTAVENKILNVSKLIRKIDYNTKINEIEKKITDHDHDKYISNPEFNNLTAENFAAILKRANLASKNEIAKFVNKTDFDNKLISLNKKNNSNKTKHLLLENKFKKLQTFDSNFFISQNYFNNDGAQLYLIFHRVFCKQKDIITTIITISGLSNVISGWESKDFHMKKLCLLIQHMKVFL